MSRRDDAWEIRVSRRQIRNKRLQKRWFIVAGRIGGKLPLSLSDPMSGPDRSFTTTSDGIVFMTCLHCPPNSVLPVSEKIQAAKHLSDESLGDSYVFSVSLMVFGGRSIHPFSHAYRNACGLLPGVWQALKDGGDKSAKM